MLVEKQITSATDYLAFERESEKRHEFIFNTIIEMAGATLIHNRLIRNLFLMIGNFLKDSKYFELFQTDMRTYNPINGSYFYPDIVVSDGEPQTIENDNLTNPILIIEILSPSTAVFDKTDKFVAYRTIETLKEYVLVYSEIPQIEVFRKDNKGIWSVETINKIESELNLNSINFSVSLKEVYQRVFEN